MNDSQVLERLRDNDPQALADAVERHAADLLRFARKVAGPAAEDVVQDTFYVLATRPPRWVGDKGLGPWLRTVARRQHRTGGREVLQSDVDPDTADSDLARQVEEQLAAADILSALSPRDRALLEARYLNDQSTASIATSWAVTTGNTRVMLSRALSRARDRAQELGYGLVGWLNWLRSPFADQSATAVAGVLGAATVLVIGGLGIVDRPGGLDGTGQQAAGGQIGQGYEVVTTFTDPWDPFELPADTGPSGSAAADTGVAGGTAGDAQDDPAPSSDGDSSSRVVPTLPHRDVTVGNFSYVDQEHDPNNPADYSLWVVPAEEVLIIDIGSVDEGDTHAPMAEAACQAFEAGEPVTTCTRQ